MVSSPGRSRDCIFISYRRDDARGASGRVWDWLRIGFGRERVFRDVASIGAGKWREKIDLALAASTACVAVIGSRWADDTNLPRLNDPTDMVRYELETALAGGERQEMTVVPVLVEEAQLRAIHTAQLPAVLQPLLGEWNVLELSESGWDDDTRRLIEAIAEATGLAAQPDLEEWLSRMAGAKRGLAATAKGQDLSTVGKAGEQQALDAMLSRVAEAPSNERAGLKAAFEALAEGNSLLAEEEFEREVESSERLIDAASQLLAAEQKKMGESARNVASLAVARGDLRKAVVFFNKALDALPDDFSAALQLGDAWIRLGSLDKASEIFGNVITQASEQREQTFEALGYNGLGYVLKARGDSQRALEAYQQGLSITKALIERDPANTQWRLYHSMSQSNIADVLIAQGNTPGGLSSYQAALAITEDLARRDSTNTQLQRELAICQERIGDVLQQQGEDTRAMVSHQASLAIRETLAQQNPTNTEWQHDLFVSKLKIGDVFLRAGDNIGARMLYQAALKIAEDLARYDSANTQWQSGLSAIHERIGSVLLTQGDNVGSLSAYQAALKITEALADQDSTNTQWLNSLSVIHRKIGNAQLAQSEDPKALKAYQQGLSITRTLVESDPANAEWQRDLFISQSLVADVQFKLGNIPAALKTYQQVIETNEALAARDQYNMQLQSDLAISQERLGDVLMKLGDSSKALTAYRAGLVITKALALQNPTNTQWRHQFFVSNRNIGYALLEQGDKQGALRSYQAALEIAEDLTQQDSTSTQWQVDIAVCCRKVSSLDSLLSISDRREYLLRGRQVLLDLKKADRLLASQDGIGWFDQALIDLE
ncbi:toll/interleukin-1 receptor domain-containing protein [Cyanobium sp. Morenito 9A2]|uniref:toll/interleukin-1 receptor domain-containing protein n=1 Tax=Cyanobium sp. Morenito 9A2 TaxID=2823718 RepID=UPI0020CEE8C4|nr:toll/interleukin-1 receptor domain-containing protein [Cyanobium sp. Morenito 9A2]MCP9850922.1 tetratricopeptide repeat protein [Cyanobium sp. Morenito 9A2]